MFSLAGLPMRFSAEKVIRFEVLLQHDRSKRKEFSYFELMAGFELQDTLQWGSPFKSASPVRAHF